MKLWKKLEVIENPPVYIDASADEVYYARDYIARGGYSASEANQLISNLKKHPRYRNTFSWQHKLAAIDRFAREIASTLTKNISVAAIPPSKIPTDPEYDSRLADMLAVLQRLRPDLTIEIPFACRTSTTASHLGGTRKIDQIVANLEWQGLSANCQVLMLVDDVLTTGAHFKACKRLLKQHAPAVRVAGLFWARTVWPEDEQPFAALPEE